MWWPAGLEDFARASAQRAWGWAQAEVAPGRLVPWLAVAFGLGTILYFTADREPSPWAAGAALAAAGAAAIAVRRRMVAFPLLLGLATIAAGFAAGTFKRAIIEHPVLQFATPNIGIAGFVEARDERERSDRIVVRVARIEGGRSDETRELERVRLTTRKGTAPAVGSYVKLKAHLTPPLEPLRPGGYDFGRDMYFQGIGASGLLLRRDRDRRGARAGRRLARLCGLSQPHPQGDRPAHPRRAAAATRARSPRRSSPASTTRSRPRSTTP